MTTQPVTNAELAHRMESLEKKVDSLSELIALNHAIKTGGSIVNWVAKVVGSTVAMIALYKYGLASMIGQGIGK